MKIVCAWCGKSLGDKESRLFPPDHITHGICPECVEGMARATGPTLRDFLNRLDAPVVVMDRDCRVLGANTKALDLIGHPVDEIECVLCGPAIECAYSHLPQGCGNTEHCPACAIRQSIQQTHDTGEPLMRVPASDDIDTPDGIRRRRMTLSTEKAADIVLLRIDEMTGPGEKPED
jgi:hypothetical protein